ncbi:hypothetical protein ACSJLL_25285, partial [Enterobacter kobei]
ALLSEQYKEIKEKNRIGKTKDFFKKIGDIKGTFYAKMSRLKDRHSKNPTKAEEIKKRSQEYTK